MARKGWFLLITSLFIIATVITLYRAVPFFLSKSLGKKIYYTGYQFRPWWTLSFQRFEAESLFYAKNLNITFKFFPFIRNHQIDEFSADTLVIFIQKRNSKHQESSTDNVTFGFKALPVLVKKLRIDVTKIVSKGHVVNLNSVKVETRPWETYWRMSALVEAVNLDTFPPHQVKFFATLHSDKVFLEGLHIKGPLAHLLVEGQTVGSVINLQIDTLALFSRFALSNTNLAIDLDRKAISLNAQTLSVDTFQFKDVKLRVTDLDTTIMIEKLAFNLRDITMSGRGTYSKPSKKGKGRFILSGSLKGFSVKNAIVVAEGDLNQILGRISVPQGKFRDLLIRDLNIEFYTGGQDSLVVKSFTSMQPNSSGEVVISKDAIRLSAEADKIDLSKIFPGVRSNMSLKIDAAGPLKNPTLQGTFIFTDLNLADVKADSGIVKVSGTPERLQISAFLPKATVFNQVVENTHLSILDNPPQAVFTGTAKSGKLEKIKITGKIRSTDKGLNLRADTILMASPELSREWLGSLTVNKTKKRTWFTLNTKDIKGGTLKILGNINKKTELTMQMEDFDLSGLPLPKPFDGNANMTVNFTGDINNPNIVCNVNWTGSVFAGNPMDSVSLKLRYANDSLIFEKSRLSVGESEMRLSGIMEIELNQITNPSQISNAPVDLNVTSWNWSITNLFNSVSTDYYADSMSFTGDVRITGTLGNPQFSGIVEVGGGPVALLPAGTVFQSLFARGTVEKNRITFKQARATSPGTSVIGTGYVTLSGFNLDTVNLKLHLKNFELRPQPEVEAWLNGSLGVKGKFPRLNIDGDLEVSKGYITMPFGRRSAVQQVEAPSPIRYRIHLTAQDRLYFINDVLQTEFQSDLTVTKDSDIGSTYSGTLTALGGTFWYLDRGFRITEGKLVFNQSTSLNPDIDFKAEYLLQDSILVTLSATGTLQEPQVNLASTPPMPLEDIVSLLAFGRTVSELSPSLTEVSYLRSRSLNLAEALLSRELKQRLRLTELEIATGLAGRDPHFTVGFYLSPRVHLRYTHDIKSPTKDVFLLNYYLTRGLGIYVERDRDGRLGGGLNFRFRF